MNQNNPANRYNKLIKLGLILGPIFIILGIILLNMRKDESSKFIPYMIIILGIVRLISSLIMIWKQKNMNSPSPD